MVILAPETICPTVCRAKVALLQNLAGQERGVQNTAGQRTKAPLFCGVNCLLSLPRGVMEPLFFASRCFAPLTLYPHRVLEQCNLCLAMSQTHSFRSQNNNNKKTLEKFNSLPFFKVILYTPLSFQ